MPSHLTRQLDQQFEHLRQHHRRQGLLLRWACDPALVGLTPDDIVELCANATSEQNSVVATLLRRHQNGDPDAGIVLLTVLRPMLKSVVHYRHRRITDALIDNYWAAASHLIGSIDPDLPPVDRDGQPVAFIAYLGNRLHQHARDLDPAARRWRDRRRRGEPVTSIDLTVLGSELPIADRYPTESSVEEIAIARVELTRVADAVRNGSISADRWCQLIEHRLGDKTRGATGANRVAVHRTATRLAGLVGRAA